MANFNPSSLKIFSSKFDPVKFNKLVDLLLRQKVRSSPNCLVSDGAGGTVIIPLGTASTIVTYPFQVSLKPDPNNVGQYLATIYPGVVNGNLFPTVNGTPMWQYVSVGGTPPSYAYPQLSVKKGDNIYITATVTAGIISALEIDSTPVGSIPAETDSLTTNTIATVDGTTGALTQLLKNNLSYAALATIYSASTRLVAHVWTVAP